MILENDIRKKFHVPNEYPIVNHLPDVWISIENGLLDDMVGESPTKKKDIELRIYMWIHSLYQKKQKVINSLEKAIKEDRLNIIKVSAAEHNPKYLGEKVKNKRIARELLIHTALSYGRSKIPAEYVDPHKIVYANE